MSAANRFGLDYGAEAARLPAPCPIIDIHAHINGPGVIPIYRRAAELYGVSRVYTQVRRGDAARVRGALGDFVRFVAFPDFRASDRAHAMGEGFLDDVRAFREEFGARIVKLWNGPRLRDFFPGDSGRDYVEFDAAWRMRHAELAQKLGMMFMVHVADPDTWFSTTYADANLYGRKIDHYRGLEAMLRRFEGPWIAAHMGGWPEDLGFLDGLLERHPNLYLDTSATKWVVRELSRHPRERVVRFFTRWNGRIVFGSDIVTLDEHLNESAPPPPGQRAHPMAALASSADEAFDLYASRYYALRTMLETGYDGESPIADPDLKVIDPGAPALAAPRLRGLSLPRDILVSLYRGAAETMLARIGATP